jgi:hypothetical protein
MPSEMVTWSDPDGGLIVDEFEFVRDTCWFEDDDEPLRLRRQRWVCIEDEVGTYWPTSVQPCDACIGEGVYYTAQRTGGANIEVRVDVIACPRCKGTGEHPLRGAGFVTEEES